MKQQTFSDIEYSNRKTQGRFFCLHIGWNNDTSSNQTNYLTQDNPLSGHP